MPHPQLSGANRQLDGAPAIRQAREATQDMSAHIRYSQSAQCILLCTYPLVVNQGVQTAREPISGNRVVCFRLYCFQSLPSSYRGAHIHARRLGSTYGRLIL